MPSILDEDKKTLRRIRIKDTILFALVFFIFIFEYHTASDPTEKITNLVMANICTALYAIIALENWIQLTVKELYEKIREQECAKK